MKYFPILQGYNHSAPKIELKVPWELIALHEKQAYRNHGQTLERLAERGGLCSSEILSVISDITWQANLDEDWCLNILDGIVSAFNKLQAVKDLHKKIEEII